jgi:hypothetical protein
MANKVVEDIVQATAHLLEHYSEKESLENQL